jgi:hypothetical protein
MAVPIPPIVAPLDPGKEGALALSVAGGGMMDMVSNRLWLLAAGSNGEPMPAQVEFTMARQPAQTTSALPRLGLAALDVVPNALNQMLRMVAATPEEKLTWEEMVAPDRLARIDLSPVTLPGAHGARTTIRAHGGSTATELFCSLWWGGHAMVRAFRIPLVEASGTAELDVPAEGIYWVACGDEYAAAGAPQAFALLLASDQADVWLQELLSGLTDPPVLRGWPPVARMDAAEKQAAAEFVGSRVVPPPVMERSLLLDTFARDQARVNNQIEWHRTSLLVAAAMVAAGLMFWGIGVAVIQTRRQRREIETYQDAEGIGEGLPRLETGSRRMVLPYVLVTIAIAVDLAAVAWLACMIFGAG